MFCLCQIKDRFDEANGYCETLKHKFEDVKRAKTEATEQLADINKLIKQMNEAKAKYLKAIDKQNLQKVKEIAAGNGPAKLVVSEVLDGIARFVANDPNAKMRKEKGEMFDTVETFSKEVKDCFPVDRERQWLQGVA